jgi:hypothetical protein
MAKRVRPRRQTVKRRTRRDWQDQLLIAIVSACVIVVAVSSALLLRASRTPAPPSIAVMGSPQPMASPSSSLPAESSAGASTSAPGPEGPGAAPPPSAEAVELQQLHGTGASVMDGLVWAACEKAVFYWTLSPGQNGEASLTLRLQETGEAAGTVLVDEYASGLTAPITGAALHPLLGGEYTLSVEDAYSPWSVRVLCQDGELPLGDAPDLTGSVSTVTPNFELATCNQMALLWSVEPDGSGRASMIVRMYIVGRSWPDVRVNETDTDVDEPLGNLALFSVEGGEYFLVVDKVSGPWTIRWECRG